MKRYRRLRRLEPDTDLIRRRAAGETYRELCDDYGVSHTTLSRYFARPQVTKQVRLARKKFLTFSVKILVLLTAPDFR